MKIDLRRLYSLNNLDINEYINLDSSYYLNMNVKVINDLLVKGNIKVNYENNIELDLVVSGTFVMPCEITNEDCFIPFSCNINDEIEENSLNNDFYLDLSNILWENIVLEIPFRVVKEGVKLETFKGEGWEIVEE